MNKEDFLTRFDLFSIIKDNTAQHCIFCNIITTGGYCEITCELCAKDDFVDLNIFYEENFAGILIMQF